METLPNRSLFFGLCCGFLHGLCKVRAQQVPRGTGREFLSIWAHGFLREAESFSSSLDQQSTLDNPILRGRQKRHLHRIARKFGVRAQPVRRGSNSNKFNCTWQQSFGPKHRFAAAIELPVVNANGEEREEPTATGLGDLKLRARGMLWKGETFEHAAEVEITVLSARSEGVGEGQTVLRLVWGFPGELAEHTVLN